MVAVEPSRPADALEEGAVVFYPKTPFALPGGDELELMRAELPATLKAKNVSYYPDAGRLTGLKGDEALRARAGHSFVRAAKGVGLSMATVIDSSPYDRAMRRFHNFMKDSAAFRDGRDGYEEFSFPPFSSWMVLTDTRSHACVSGQHAFVDT